MKEAFYSRELVLTYIVFAYISFHFSATINFNNDLVAAYIMKVVYRDLLHIGCWQNEIHDFFLMGCYVVGF